MVSRAGRLGLSVAFVCATALARPNFAHAQEAAGDLLDQATEKLEALRYDEARDGFFAVVTSGTAEPEQLAKAYFNLGIVEAALNNGTSSIDAFYLSLMIQPSLALGLGGSPKIEVFLNQARDRVVGVGSLGASLGFGSGVLTVSIDNDPLGLVKAIVVEMSKSDDESGKVTLEPGSSSVQVDSDVESIEVVLFDETGNQLKVMSLEPGSPVDNAVAGSSPPWSNWGLWAGLAAASAGGGAFFLMKSGERGDEISSLRADGSMDSTQISRLEDEESRLGTYGLVGFGLAGAAAVAAGAILFMGDEAAGEEDVAFVPQLQPGNWGGSLFVRF